MKRQRFEDVHRAALRWPQLQFKYIGIDNEVGTSDAYSGEVRSPSFFPTPMRADPSPSRRERPASSHS